MVTSISYGHVAANPAYTEWLARYNAHEAAKPPAYIDSYAPGAAIYTYTGSVPTGAGEGVYIKAGVITTEVTSQAELETVTDYTLLADLTYCVSEITVSPHVVATPVTAIPTLSASAVRLSVAGASTLNSLTFEYNQPTDTEIWTALSFDLGLSFSIWLTDAWQVIAKLDTVWKYWDGNSFEAADENTALHALYQAWAVAANQMSLPDAEALTDTEFATTGAYDPTLGSYVDLAFGLSGGTMNVPSVLSVELNYSVALAGATVTGAAVTGWSEGEWTAGASGSEWTDSTAVAGESLAVSGTILYNYNSEAFPATYKFFQDIPGYWFQLEVSTSVDCELARILYSAKCQDLSNIGTGVPLTPLAFLFHDVTGGTVQDYTVEVSDSTYSELSIATVSMDDAAYLYLGLEYKFGEADINMWTSNNSATATLRGEYWNGSYWIDLFVFDGTSTGGCTLKQRGKLSWSIPDDWHQAIPINTNIPRAYYVRFYVSDTITAGTSISEIRLYPVPDALKKYTFAATLDDRLALIARSDKPNQVDLSRPWEEYGFFGDQTAAYEVGALDRIECAVSAWNSLFLGKRETWVQIAMGDGGYQVQSVEASRHLPVNGEVIVKVPMSGQDGTKYGLAFINRHGAFVSSGLQTDNAFNTSRGFGMGQAVCWWNQEQAEALGLVYLDPDSLHLAQGAYWPVKNWCLWNALFSDGTWRVMVYDLNLNCWQPYIEGWDLRSICLAYRENGAPVLYGGTSHGTVLRLFDGDVDTDYVDGAEVDTAISASLTTTLLGSGDATWELRRLKAIGAADSNITVAIYVDGSDTVHAAGTLTLPGLTNPVGKDFAKDLHTREVRGNFFQLAFTVTGPAELHGALVELGLVRQELL